MVRKASLASAGFGIGRSGGEAQAEKGQGGEEGNFERASFHEAEWGGWFVGRRGPRVVSSRSTDGILALCDKFGFFFTREKECGSRALEVRRGAAGVSRGSSRRSRQSAIAGAVPVSEAEGEGDGDSAAADVSAAVVATSMVTPAVMTSSEDRATAAVVPAGVGLDDPAVDGSAAALVANDDVGLVDRGSASSAVVGDQGAGLVASVGFGRGRGGEEAESEERESREKGDFEGARFHGFRCLVVGGYWWDVVRSATSY